MPGILTRSSNNLNGNKFKTVLGIGSIQNSLGSTYDAEHEADEEDAASAARPSSPPPVKSRGRKLRARVPADHRHPESTMPASVDIKPPRAARPVRMDAQDGPWSVSVAEASPRSLTIYIKTPTHHLTLTRTPHEIAELHAKLLDQVAAGTTLPPCPLEADQPQKRKSSFLTTLSRLASPPRHPHPHLTPAHEQQDEITDPFLSAEPSATSALASYLTALSNDKGVRVTRPWKRFVRVRTDDLESTRVERAIKRVRSDIAMHGGTNVPLISTTVVGSTCSSNASAEDHPRRIDREGSGFPGQSIREEDEGTEHNGLLSAHAQPVTPDSASADEHARRLVASGLVDFSEPPPPPVIIRSPLTRTVEPKPEPVAPKEEMEGPPEAKIDSSAASTVEDVQKRTEERRIPRSASADWDKASRRSRSFQNSPIPPPQSETDAEGTEVTDAEDTDAFGVGTMSDAGRPGAIDQAVKKKKKKKQKLERKSRKVVIDDFEMMRVLGKGCAGKVLLVRHKRSQALYALKAITKRHVLAHQELQHTMTEQAVLKRMARSNTDPFVVKLYWSFHDKENLFLVMDFHPGGDLATQLARWGRLGRDRARFYAAEIAEGCEGLHAAGVIYRDLKPENILIGSDGHIVLTDFGLSKEFPRRRPTAPNSNDTAGSDFYASSPSTPTGEKFGGLPYWMNDGSVSQKDLWLATKANDTTTTFCGTAEYLAPEVIQGLPYSYEVDWWSFGTMLYEMLTGITPFWAQNHSEMYVRVLQDELTFPEDKAMDQDTKSLIRGLLQRNPALRLCEPRIKRHPYFSMIDWQHVYHKRYIPPYIPPIDPANASDTQNFDDAFLVMEPVLDSEVENDDQTGSERDRSTTDIEPSHDEDSVQTSPKVDSPSAQQKVENDVFDGYSFKARNSVLIDIEDEGGDVASDGSYEESIPAKDSIPEQPEDEMDAGQKTPDAHVQAAPPTQTPASAVAEAFRKQQGQQADTKPTVETTADEVDAEAARMTPRNKVEELRAEATPTTPEKDLPEPPEVTGEKVKVSQAPTVPAKEEKRVVTISEVPKPKTEHRAKPARNVKPVRRERSGVAALDRDLSDVIDEHDEMGLDAEDDDWDFVETPGGQEDYSSQQVKSLFARGVVDRYRLKVFRKPSGTTPSKSIQRNPSSSTSGLPMSESEFGELPDTAASPSPSDKKRKGGGGLSLKKGRTFLRPKSPSATYSAGSSRLSRPPLSTQHSTTMSGSSSGALLTPSATTPVSALPTNGTTSLKSQPSMNSVGSPGSSDTSVNGTRGSVATAELASPEKSRGNKSSPDLRRQTRESQTDGDESRQKGLKKMRKYTEQGAEKVMSLFSSPRPSPAQ